MRGAAMSFTAAATGCVVFLLSVSVVELQSVADWKVTHSSTRICAVIGSSVDMHCTFTYPPIWEGEVNTLVKTFWFLPGGIQVDLKGDPAYSGRVQYRCNESDSTMTISDLRQSDSTVYRFRLETTQSAFYGEGGVTLSVTALQVEVTGSSPRSLKCVSSCRGRPSYIWFRNGQTAAEGIYYTYSDTADNNYSCAVKGCEGFPSPAVYAPRVPLVSVSPSVDIMEGSSVTLTCSSDANPAATYTWNKKGYADPAPLSKAPQLFFGSIQSSDSAEYFCIAQNALLWRTSEYVFINVKYAPRLLSVSVSPSAEIVEGSSVTLTCSSDANPAANYTWYKEDQVLFQGREGSYSFPSIRSEDRGIYYCKSENQYGHIMSSSLSVDVLYAPRLLSVSVSPPGEIVEGSSVTLTCSSDANPAANYTWYKEDRSLLEGSAGIHHFPSIRSEDRGIYYCKSENQYGHVMSSSLSVDVLYAPRLLSVSVSPSAEIVEGSSVNLTCSSDANPAANYTWYKEDQDSPAASGQIFTITDFRSNHSGNYYCEARNKIGFKKSALYLSVFAEKLSMSNIIRLSLVVVMLIPLLLLCLWMSCFRKKEILLSTTEVNEAAETVELEADPVYVNVLDLRRVTTERTEDPEEQEDLV